MRTALPHTPTDLLPAVRDAEALLVVLACLVMRRCEVAFHVRVSPELQGEPGSLTQPRPLSLPVIPLCSTTPRVYPVMYGLAQT